MSEILWLKQDGTSTETCRELLHGNRFQYPIVTCVIYSGREIHSIPQRGTISLYLSTILHIPNRIRQIRPNVLDTTIVGGHNELVYGVEVLLSPFVTHNSMALLAARIDARLLHKGLRLEGLGVDDLSKISGCEDINIFVSSYYAWLLSLKYPHMFINQPTSQNGVLTWFREHSAEFPEEEHLVDLVWKYLESEVAEELSGRSLVLPLPYSEEVWLYPREGRFFKIKR
jgi:hypothetical protein